MTESSYPADDAGRAALAAAAAVTMLIAETVRKGDIAEPDAFRINSTLSQAAADAAHETMQAEPDTPAREAAYRAALQAARSALARHSIIAGVCGREQAAAIAAGAAAFAILSLAAPAPAGIAAAAHSAAVRALRDALDQEESPDGPGLP